jgi:hypothetical protein
MPRDIVTTQGRLHNTMKPNLDLSVRSMLHTIVLNRASTLLGLVADYYISVACCSPLDGFDVAGDGASMLKFAFFSETCNKNDGKKCSGLGVTFLRELGRDHEIGDRDRQRAPSTTFPPTIQ